MLDVALVALACVSVGCSGLVLVCRLLKAAFRYATSRRKCHTCGVLQDFHPLKYLSWRHLDFLDIMQPKDKAGELVRTWQTAVQQRFQGSFMLPVLTLWLSFDLVDMVQAGADASATLKNRYYMPATSLGIIVIMVSCVCGGA